MIDSKQLLTHLLAIDHFYRELGGIVGYQATILELLKGEERKIEGDAYHSPSFISIEDETEEVKRSISWGIESLPLMAELYPLGGAADRLHLIDETTGADLPAAKLIFGGLTLFERLVRDLQAR